MTAAHRDGCRYLDAMYRKTIPAQADIVLVSQGGAPKDANLYQTQKALDNAKHAVKKGGTIVLVGYSKTGEMNLPMSLILDKEQTLKSVVRYRHIYPMAIDAVAAGKVNVKGIVTDIFEFDDIQNAMDKSVADKANIVKAVVKIGE